MVVGVTSGVDSTVKGACKLVGCVMNLAVEDWG